MRGEIAYKILDFLEDKSMEATDLVGGFLAAGYGASMGKMEYQFSIRDQKRHSYKINRERRRNLQKYIYKLKSDGFLSEDPDRKISLSTKGKKKLGSLKENKVLDRKEYRKEI